MDANDDGSIATGLQIAFVKVSDSVFYALFDDGVPDQIKILMIWWLDRCRPIATPLPGALPLFAGGLGALGLLGWRRKRRPQRLLDRSKIWD